MTKKLLFLKFDKWLVSHYSATAKNNPKFVIFELYKQLFLIYHRIYNDQNVVILEKVVYNILTSPAPQNV